MNILILIRRSFVLNNNMGLKSNHIDSVTMGDGFSRTVLNPSKMGSCYICIHKQGELIEKKRHHSLFIDVAGESHFHTNGELIRLIGLMLHVTAKPLTGKTKYRHGRAKIKPYIDQVYPVGQMFNPERLSPPRWAINLMAVVSDHLKDHRTLSSLFSFQGDQVYEELVATNGSKDIWSGNLNCQMFVRKMVEVLNLSYPSDIISTDLSPSIVSFSILCIRASAKAKAKIADEENGDGDFN